MIFVEVLFAYFAATKRGWNWWVVFPLIVDILCFSLLLNASLQLIATVGYLFSLLTLGLMLAFPKDVFLQSR
ncbi:MAG: hypothetical protein ACFB4I_18550 [Cyanophyceae cyanobacterium]